jgi:hypothetical protein
VPQSSQEKIETLGKTAVIVFFLKVMGRKSLLSLKDKLIFGEESHLMMLRICAQSRDRTGMEVNPLVFETSASTNSAIWASLEKIGCKSTYIFDK